MGIFDSVFDKLQEFVDDKYNLEEKGSLTFKRIAEEGINDVKRNLNQKGHRYKNKSILINKDGEKGLNTIPGSPIDNVLDAMGIEGVLKRKVDGVTSEEAKRKFKEGDHLYVQREGYTHHGIATGRGNVIHYLSTGIIEEDMDVFSAGELVNQKKSHQSFDGKTVLSRAKRKIGENNYNVLWNNCEQFALWCRNGSYTR